MEPPRPSGSSRRMRNAAIPSRGRQAAGRAARGAGDEPQSKGAGPEAQQCVRDGIAFHDDLAFPAGGQGRGKGTHGCPPAHRPQPALAAALAKTAARAGVEIRWETSITGFARREGAVDFQTSAGELETRVLVAADGLHSVLNWIKRVQKQQ
jgi:2-polyprenyl-6-methoxyphenol hydroxylase-like FAD-dependent oxidoreductase